MSFSKIVPVAVGRDKDGRKPMGRHHNKHCHKPMAKKPMPRRRPIDR